MKDQDFIELPEGAAEEIIRKIRESGRVVYLTPKNPEDPQSQMIVRVPDFEE